MKKDHREMTDDELKIFVQEMQHTVRRRMKQINKALPPGYKLTLVCRHEVEKDAQLIFSNDNLGLEDAAAILTKYVEDQKAAQLEGKDEQPQPAND